MNSSNSLLRLRFEIHTIWGNRFYLNSGGSESLTPSFGCLGVKRFYNLQDFILGENKLGYSVLRFDDVIAMIVVIQDDLYAASVVRVYHSTTYFNAVPG